MQASREPYFWELVLIQGSGLDGCALLPPPSRAQKQLVLETAAFQPNFQAGQADREPEEQGGSHPGSKATSTGAG